MIQQKQFSETIFSMKGISKKTVEEHLKLYAGYIAKYNEITDKLKALSDEDYAKANQVFSSIRSLKTELSFAWGGIVNHEIYFTHLGGNGGRRVVIYLNKLTKILGLLMLTKKT